VTLIRRARAAVAELRSIETPSVPLTSATLVELLGGQRTHSGVHVSENTAHRVISVYRAWSLLAGTIGSLPFRAFTGEPPGGDRWTGDAAGLLAYPGGRDEVTGIATPGAPSAMVFFETLMVHLLSWGNAYVVKVPNVARSRIVALDLLMPNQVLPRWVRRTETNPYGKEFVVVDDDGVSVSTPADVIHIRALGSSLLQGISPIGAARQALGLAVAAEEYGARLFGSGSLMAGILHTDQRLEPAQADALKQRWRDKLTGLAHAHDVAILDSGAKWQPIGIPPQDSQFIESRKFQVTEVARLYGIPPHMLGDVEKSTSWGSGIEQQGIGFNIYTLRPWLTRVEQALSNELLPRGVNCRFDVSELLRGDMQAEIAAHQTAILSGQETPNEARAARGKPPLPGGDHLFFPANYATMAAIVNPPEPAPAPLPPSAPIPDGGANGGN
jgi:HK97 family phage portal protein